jgi:hypothetical protein
MKNRFRKGYGIFLGLLWTGLAFSAVLSPAIQIAAPDHDFGEVEEGTLVVHDYSIKNTGQGILEIKEVQPG